MKNLSTTLSRVLPLLLAVGVLGACSAASITFSGTCTDQAGGGHLCAATISAPGDFDFEGVCSQADGGYSCVGAVATISATQQAATGPNIAACERPYTEGSIWNTPINWASAQPHADSPNMVADLFQHHSYVASDATQYAHTIYLVDSSQPLVEVRLQNSYRDSVQVDAQGNLVESLDVRDAGQSQFLPIPPEAVPSPGTDGTLVVVVTDTGYEYGLREAVKQPDGTWEAATAYEYHTTFDGVPEANFQFRGADSPLLPGTVRRCEVETKGVIDHAVWLGYDYPIGESQAAANGWPFFIPPWTDSDGFSSDRYAIPEGARVAIDPARTPAEINAACNGHTGCILWVQAMQTYGGFVLDRAGRPSTGPEGQASAGWSTGLWESDMLRNVPQSWYMVLDWDTDR